MKLVFIHAHPADKLSARLTLWFTGSTAYHCGFVCEETGTFYDMNLLPRKLAWPRYNPPKWTTAYTMPKLTREMCEENLKRDSTITYGWLDYILFGLRPIYHLLGKSTRNVGGMICSEMCALWLCEAGYDAPVDPVPSPARPTWSGGLLTAVNNDRSRALMGTDCYDNVGTARKPMGRKCTTYSTRSSESLAASRI